MFSSYKFYGPSSDSLSQLRMVSWWSKYGDSYSFEISSQRSKCVWRHSLGQDIHWPFVCWGFFGVMPFQNRLVPLGRSFWRGSPKLPLGTFWWLWSMGGRTFRKGVPAQVVQISRQSPKCLGSRLEAVWLRLPWWRGSFPGIPQRLMRLI